MGCPRKTSVIADEMSEGKERPNGKKAFMETSMSVEQW
jgi:hypothetical protein